MGLGANLPSVRFGPPRATLTAALAALAQRDVVIVGQSPWYRSAPVPPSAQPWYLNAIAVVKTELDPHALLVRLLAVESEFGRVRCTPNAPRPIDLDLLAYGARAIDRGGPLELPHPRMHLRAFVLMPMADIAPMWRHPRLGATVRELLAALPVAERAEVTRDDEKST
ncbi:MAG: 2-amino-4-hydroxy-6-hydroxymethyldihydropteridine diphosphokinase [Alphaproteobacteria bacterium]|nr:2-amino-4-hydroxy-6-hydroxymethyldihydropteridine diphosphokinase [Alphaproteobacteria bacterium]